MKTAKEKMLAILDKLPDDVTWEGAMQEFYLRLES